MKRYIKVWYLLTIDSLQALIATRWAMLIFISGKLLRIGMFFGFVYFIFSGPQRLLGYSQWQVLLFVSVFYLISSVGQMFFREVYRFRPKIISGEFDADLIKPIHPLLRNVFGGFDLQDLVTMPVLFYVLGVVLVHLAFRPVELLVFLALCLNSLLLMFAIHVFAAAMIILVPDVDHGLMMYRDIETMGRFPVDIYAEPLRQILTFVVPIGVMFTIPAKSLIGWVSPLGVGVAFTSGLLSTYLVLRFWNYAVSQYSSASS